MTPEDRKKLCHDLLEDGASFVLRRTSRNLAQRYDEALSTTGLKVTQLALLMTVELHPGQPLHVVAREAGLSPSTISRNLQPLVRRGLVEISGSNRGGKRAALTDEGVARLEQALPVCMKLQDRFEASFGNSAWMRLRQALQRTARNFANED